MSPVNTEGYEDVLGDLEKSYEGAIMDGDRYDDPERISTSSPMLDWAMGGGVPQGRFTRLYGHHSSGKTHVAIKLIAEAQKLGLTCVYYNIEKQYHKGHFMNCGVNVKDLKVIHKTRIEEVGEIAESLMGVRHVHVFDSCSAARSIDAAKGEIADWHRGLKARAWNKVFDALLDVFDEHDNTLVWIDQVRVNQNTGAELPTGGKQMSHESAMTVKFRRAKWLNRDRQGNLTDKDSDTMTKTISGQKEPQGIEMIARVEKSKVGRPLRTAVMQFDFKKGTFDNSFELAKAGVFLGVVQQNGAWLSMNNGKAKGKRFQGMSKFRDEIKSNAALRKHIEHRLSEYVEA